MAQLSEPESSLRRTARLTAIATVCVLVIAAVYVATLYLITSS